MPLHIYSAKQKEMKHCRFLMPVCGKDKFDFYRAAAAEALLIFLSERMAQLWSNTDVSSKKVM